MGKIKKYIYQRINKYGHRQFYFCDVSLNEAKLRDIPDRMWVSKERERAIKEGQIKMFNRLWDTIPPQKKDIFADAASFALALVKELNKIREELEEDR